MSVCEGQALRDHATVGQLDLHFTDDLQAKPLPQ